MKPIDADALLRHLMAKSPTNEAMQVMLKECIAEVRAAPELKKEEIQEWLETEETAKEREQDRRARLKAETQMVSAEDILKHPRIQWEIVGGATPYIRHQSSVNFGVFLVQKNGDFVYIGRTRDGWWDWIATLEEKDLKENFIVNRLIGSQKYLHEGCSATYFGSLDELLADLWDSEPPAIHEAFTRCRGKDQPVRVVFDWSQCPETSWAKAKATVDSTPLGPLAITVDGKTYAVHMTHRSSRDGLNDLDVKVYAVGTDDELQWLDGFGALTSATDYLEFRVYTEKMMLSFLRGLG